MLPVGIYEPMPSLITSPHLTLEPWRDDDLSAYRELVYERDQRAAAAPRDGRPTDEDLRSTIVRQQASLADTGLALLTIRLRGDFIGYCGLTVGRASVDEPEIAYELVRRAYGHGYATEAGQAIVAVAIDTGRSRLWATVRPWNAASFRALDKLMFCRRRRSASMSSASCTGYCGRCRKP